MIDGCVTLSGKVYRLRLSHAFLTYNWPPQSTQEAHTRTTRRGQEKDKRRTRPVRRSWEGGEGSKYGGTKRCEERLLIGSGDSTNRQLSFLFFVSFFLSSSSRLAVSVGI